MPNPRWMLPALCAAAAGCTGSPTSPPVATVQIANPASTYCIEQGGRLERRKDDAGNTYGLCHLPDGTTLEEWALFRRDHP